MPALIAEQAGCYNILLARRATVTMRNQVFTGALEEPGASKRDPMLTGVALNVVLPHRFFAVVAETFLT